MIITGHKVKILLQLTMKVTHFSFFIFLFGFLNFNVYASQKENIEYEVNYLKVEYFVSNSVDKWETQNEICVDPNLVNILIGDTYNTVLLLSNPNAENAEEIYEQLSKQDIYDRVIGLYLSDEKAQKEYLRDVRYWLMQYFGASSVRAGYPGGIRGVTKLRSLSHETSGLILESNLRKKTTKYHNFLLLAGNHVIYEIDGDHRQWQLFLEAENLGIIRPDHDYGDSELDKLRRR